MIKVYFLSIRRIDNADTVAGIELIHDAILETTESPDIRKLIMDTTTEEDALLTVIASEARDATQPEIDLYNSQVIITPPNPDIERAIELLSTSPLVITQPEMWELLRIFGRMHGLSV